MALTATMLAAEPRSFSDGPLKKQFFTYTAISGDTSGTITLDRLSLVLAIFMDGGLVNTAAPTFATNVATVAFADPLANAFGSGYAVGR